MGKRRIKFDLLIHDLKGPLAVIETGIISLLQRQEKYGPLTEKQQKVLKRVLRNTVVTKTLVNDALAVSRSTEGIISENKFVISNLINQSLEELFDLMDRDDEVRLKECMDLSVLQSMLSEREIHLDIDESLWCRQVVLDVPKMSQVLRNLLSNALKYKKHRVELKIEARDHHLIVSVSDDGQGIPESYHQQIFECYFQMDQQRDYCVRGHGLGLAGVMVLVEDMGGELSLESDEGKGARFSVKIPLVT